MVGSRGPNDKQQYIYIYGYVYRYDQTKEKGIIYR